jgi:hypothetical protein
LDKSQPKSSEQTDAKCLVWTPRNQWSHLQPKPAVTSRETGLTRASSPPFAAFTRGCGFDAVIITAATQSTDPVELAASILRQKGVMVIVGAVPMNMLRVAGEHR